MPSCFGLLMLPECYAKVRTQANPIQGGALRTERRRSFTWRVFLSRSFVSRLKTATGNLCHNAGQEITYDAALYHFQAAYAAVKDSSEFKDSKFTDADGDSRVPGWHDLRRMFARHARRAGVADSEIMNIAAGKLTLCSCVT